MNPQVELLAKTSFNWVSFRATVDSALQLRPDSVLNALPISFSDDAKVLLNIAAVHGMSIKNPLDILRHLPYTIMDFLSYQFLIVCDKGTRHELDLPNVTLVKCKVSEGFLLFATGSLAAWYEAVKLNLAKGGKIETRLVMNKIVLILEQQGLQAVFDSLTKVSKSDGTFLLKGE